MIIAAVSGLKVGQKSGGNTEGC